MPAKKSHGLVASELRATLDRFIAWQTRARANPKEGRKDATPMTARGYAARVSRFLRWAGRLNPTPEQARAYHERFLLDAVTNRSGLNSASSGRQNAYALRSWHPFRNEPLPADALTIPTLPKPDTPAFLDLDECRRRLEAIDNRRDYGFVSTILNSGIPASEAAALKVRHFDPDLRVLRVPLAARKAGPVGRARRPEPSSSTRRPPKPSRSRCATVTTGANPKRPSSGAKAPRTT